jgi:ubiquinone/menaquinone biosynthesis C-methylase UbiE
MNIFENEVIAQEYDAYYKTEQGKLVDELEKKAIRQLLAPVKPGCLLEIGCGTGHWTAFFSEQGFRITATDVSEAMLDLARKKQISNTTFMEADVLQLPFPDNHLDQVAAITALEFCGNIKQAFTEMKRVLKPGGWLVVGCLNSDSTLGKVKNQDPVFQHGHFMSKEELENHLLTIGKPELLECVRLSTGFQLLDGTKEEHSVAGVFMAAAVQKIN